MADRLENFITYACITCQFYLSKQIIILIGKTNIYRMLFCFHYFILKGIIHRYSFLLYSLSYIIVRYDMVYD